MEPVVKILIFERFRSTFKDEFNDASLPSHLFSVTLDKR